MFNTVTIEKQNAIVPLNENWKCEGEAVILATCFACSSLEYLSNFCMLYEVTRNWRKLRNEELHNLYSSPSIMRLIKLRRIKLAGHVARMWCRGKPEGKKPQGRPRCRLENNIKLER
jgi:hypothetical protein